MTIQHQQFNDGSRSEVAPDGGWDLTLPTGKHVRGKAQDITAANQAVQAERERFILAAWAKGTLGPMSGQFVCSLR
jgi:hypothetical protein